MLPNGTTEVGPISVDGKLANAPVCYHNSCSSRKTNNSCVEYRGAYTCLCMESGWQPSDDKQSCLPPAQQCIADECSTSENRLNSCHDNRNGTYYCNCTAPGWSVSRNLSVCVAPPVQCLSDECTSSGDSRNVCQVYSLLTPSTFFLRD